MVESQERKQDTSVDHRALEERLRIETRRDLGTRFDQPSPSPSRAREENSRFADDLTMLKAERVATESDKKSEDGHNMARRSTQLHRSRSRQPEPLDEFDVATNPLHERNAVYRPPEHPTTKIAKFFKYIHHSSWVVRYFTYIVPVVVILLIPLLVGRFLPKGEKASVGGVNLFWFSIWLQIVWLTLWAGRLVAKLIPYPLGLISSLFTNNSKKWRDLGKQLEIPATIFFWWLGVEISFLPTMKNHHIDGDKTTRPWETTLNKIIISVFVGATLNFVEKLCIQLIAISFHLRTYADRIENNKFQIGSLTKLYIYSKRKIAMEDAEFEEKPSGLASGTRTPAQMADRAVVAINKAVARVGDVAGGIAGDFTGKSVTKSSHPHQVILTLLHSNAGSQVLARRMYRTFVRDGFETISSGDLKAAFDVEEEADAAFNMFDKDMNGDISMEELEAVCVEIGKERKSITHALKDLDSVVSKLDDVLFFVVLAITVLVLISILSTSASGILTSAGSAVLALSWLFSATAQEFLQSVIFVFVKHPFDVGDRVSIYGNTGMSLKGDDYYVKEIALLYTEFKKMEGHVVQAPNSYLNTLFILNMRRSGGLAEALPIVIRFGTTLDQIDGMRLQLLEFVRSEKREYQGNILTELRDVTEAYSLTLNVVFFYKSNWQNELIRLQRRNKFICSLMIAMQDHGIEGPRRNQAGWTSDAPVFLHGSGLPPYTSTAQTTDNNPPSMPEPSSAQPHSTATNTHPSILRSRADSSFSSRRRGESLSQMSRRVDFTLGMKDVQGGDSFSDVYDDQVNPDHLETIRQANRADEQRRHDDQRRIEEETIDEFGEAHASGQDVLPDQRSRSRTNRSQMAGGLMRRSTTFGPRVTSRSGPRASMSSDTHRNRFFGRFSQNPGRASIDIPARVEEGRAHMIDPRSGQIDAEAVRTDSTTSGVVPFPSYSSGPSQGPDYEMRHMTRPS